MNNITITQKEINLNEVFDNTFNTNYNDKNAESNNTQECKEDKNFRRILNIIFIFHPKGKVI